MNNIIDTLTKEELSSIRLVKYAKGETMFQEEDLCVYVGIVLKGEITISSYSFEGKEINFKVIKPGEMFGNNLIFSSNPYYKGDVISSLESEVYLINKANLIKILQSNIPFLTHYINAASDATINLYSKVKLLSLDSAEERFLYFLHNNGGSITYQSVTSLAKQLSLSREALSRLITVLKKKNKIKVTKNKEIIVI